MEEVRKYLPVFTYLSNIDTWDTYSYSCDNRHHDYPHIGHGKGTVPAGVVIVVDHTNSPGQYDECWQTCIWYRGDNYNYNK